MFVTRVDTGEDIEVRPPPGTVGFDYQGAFSPDGETVAVATLRPTQVRPIARRDIAHVRELQTV